MSGSIATVGGFKDQRYRDEVLSARSYGQALLAAAKANDRIVCLGADLSQPTETYLFRDELPDRFFMLGIQEANMIGVAGGMARCGDIPFAHSFCVFITRRVYDQIAMQLAYPNANAKIVGFIPGLTTELGVSHQAIDDIALMRALPNMTVFEPSGPEQVGAAFQAALDHEGPVYLRLSMMYGAPAPDESTPLVPLERGKGLIIAKGADAAIIASGIMVSEALKARALLAERGISAAVANFASLKPLDTALVEELARTRRALVTAENHSVIGGLGAAVAETIALSNARPRFGMIGVKDVFAEGGSTPFLLQRYGLAASDIARKVEELHRLG
jgi:transketolase